MENLVDSREGGDIFAEDMVHVDVESPIVGIFENATVLLTGGTGYIGKMFLEKILRVCPKVKRIYLLIRPKKGKEVSKRFEEIFDGPNMVPLKLANPNYINKVSIVNGDCSLPDLGLDIEDKQKLIDEVNFVIHCAATVKFDEKLKLATYINVRAVRDILKMSKQMKNLKAFLHVSTAFCNCYLQKIDETFYKTRISAENLLKLVELMDDETLEKITPEFLGEFPNTYVLTKSVAEDYISREAKNLPIAVIRPSIVIASLTEPVAGWIDNHYGATGIFVGAALGLLRSLNGNEKNLAEMIPADYVINAGIAVLWETARTKSLNHNIENKMIEDETATAATTTTNIDDIAVYNIVSSPENPITWERFMKYAEKHTPHVPSELQIWHYFFKLRENKLYHALAVLFFHTIPAYIVDFICMCLGKQQLMVKGYQKINKFMDVISYFSLREWYFCNNNVQKLWQKLDNEDKRLFQFSVTTYDWENYFYFYARGARVYLLKDPLDTIPKGKIKYWKLFIAHYTLMAILILFFFKLLCIFWSFLF